MVTKVQQNLLPELDDGVPRGNVTVLQLLDQGMVGVSCKGYAGIRVPPAQRR